MDFRDQFRKMSDDVTKMARDVADTSKKATARARIRRMINSCNSSLQSIYSEIGSRYYVENRCEPEEQYAGLFEQAADLIAQIDTLKSELASLENASICPECGCKNASYGRWKAEAEAAEAARKAAKEAQQAERTAHKEAETETYETTATVVPAEESDSSDAETTEEKTQD